ncbi:MAG: retroviral-like aspartic protease family protein [Bacteroidetes bacterium]|nr:retroviral-like aspartic protease family protein [Bacteroidota bacterium]MDI6779391.1 retropepsin-like aspartic protease [Bacteroidota bacterium]
MKCRLDIQESVIPLKVRLEGEREVKKINMALDTGATYVMLPWEIAEVLGYEPELSKERINMITASGVEKVPLITLKVVDVLGKRAENIKAIVHDLPQESYVDGLLGLSFLKNFNVSLKFREGVLEIE